MRHKFSGKESDIAPSQIPGFNSEISGDSEIPGYAAVHSQVKSSAIAAFMVD
jgi:hypothetical protein